MFKVLRRKLFTRYLIKYKPDIINEYYIQVDKQLLKEYEDSLNNERGQVQELNRKLNKTESNVLKLQTKYDNLLVIHEQLLNKVAKANTDKGELKNEIKHLRTELKDKQEEINS